MSSFLSQLMEQQIKEVAPEKENIEESDEKNNVPEEYQDLVDKDINWSDSEVEKIFKSRHLKAKAQKN